MPGPFDYVASINSSKKNIMLNDADEKTYAPFIINRSLSMFPDTLFHSNIMNRYGGVLDKRLQYDYLRNAVSAKKRYAKWLKRKQDEDLEYIMEFYKYSATKAKAVLAILTKEQLSEIKKSLEKGGDNAK